MGARYRTSWGSSDEIVQPETVDIDTQRLADDLVGYVALQREDGYAIFDEKQKMAQPVGDVPEETVRRAVEQVTRDGLRVLATSGLGIAVTGSQRAWNNLHGGRTTTREVMVQRRRGVFAYVHYADVVDKSDGDIQPARHGIGVVAPSKEGISGVGFEMARTPLHLSAVAPEVTTRFHLRVPQDVSALTGAASAHEQQYAGQGVTVAMIDTGHFRHPFFGAYDVRRAIAIVDGTSGGRDPVGHGTAESANVFAVAPRATLWPYRASNEAGDLVAPLAAFMRAKADRPKDRDGKPLPYVITCSWGADWTGPLPEEPVGMDRPMVAEILDAIDQGIVVVFAAGNGGHSIEAQVPGVISAGAAFVDEQFTVIASDYGSAYRSRWKPDITVPTVCGLVGMRPRAAYILLPVPPGCMIDDERSLATADDAADGTRGDDGWAMLSGTSAAAPQVAGAAAVLLSANGDLTPKEVKDYLGQRAIDIRAGRPSPRFADEAGPATRGPDIATGYGLIDVGASLTALLEDACVAAG